MTDMDLIDEFATPTYKVGDVVWGCTFMGESCRRFTIAEIKDGFAIDSIGVKYRLIFLSRTKNGLIKMLFNA